MFGVLTIVANVSAPAFTPVGTAGNQANTFLALLNDSIPEESAVVPTPFNDAKGDVAVSASSTGKAVPKDTSQAEHKERPLFVGSSIVVPGQIAQALPVPAKTAANEPAGATAITSVSKQENEGVKTQVIAPGLPVRKFPSASSSPIMDEPQPPSSDTHALNVKEKNAPETASAFDCTPQPRQSGNDRSDVNSSAQTQVQDTKPGLQTASKVPAGEATVQAHSMIGSDRQGERSSSRPQQSHEQATEQVASALACKSSNHHVEDAVRAVTEPAQRASGLNPASRKKSDEKLVGGHPAEQAMAPSDLNLLLPSSEADRPPGTPTDQLNAALPNQTLGAPNVELIYGMSPIPAAKPEKPVAGQKGPLDVQRANSGPETHEGRIRSLVHSIESSAKEVLAKVAIPSANPRELPSQPGMEHMRQVLASDSKADSKPSSRAEAHPIETRANARQREANRPTDDEISSTKSERQIQPAQPLITQATERPHEGNGAPAGRWGNTVSSTADSCGVASISSENDIGHLEPSGNTPRTEARLTSTDTSVHAARMLQSEGRSEMRIGLRTEHFGAVQVHTSVSAGKVDVALGSERGDLKAFLAAELPALRDHLQTRGHHLQENRTPAQTADGYSGSSSGGHANQPWRQRGSMARQGFWRDEMSERENALPQGTALNVTA